MRFVRILSLAVPALLALALAPAARAEAAKPAEKPAAANDEKEAFGRLSVDDVQKLLGEKNVAVFDNNNADRYAQGHVPGAKHLPITDIKAADLPSDKDARLVFYCANEKCMACHVGAKKALELGYKNVFIMPQGIMGWEKAGKPLEKKS